MTSLVASAPPAPTSAPGESGGCLLFVFKCCAQDSSQCSLCSSSFCKLIPNNHFRSKLKELSRRTTFIRVSQQLNEVFGSKDESKHPVFAAIPDHSMDKTSAEPDAKKARND